MGCHLASLLLKGNKVLNWITIQPDMAQLPMISSKWQWQLIVQNLILICISLIVSFASFAVTEISRFSNDVACVQLIFNEK